MIAGETTFVRTIDRTGIGDPEIVQSFGGAVRLGALRSVRDGNGVAFGQVVLSIEAGYASGDADPYDGISRRFVFDHNHKVGLVLFDHVLRWKTARAATIAQDPAIVARPAPGIDFLPTEGAVAGASYLYPTLIMRPVRHVDFKAGLVIAQTTSDLVDPFHAGALGDYANYDGGDERRHDLGIEVDAGAEGRIPLGDSAVVNLGIEAGLLVTGGAFDDDSGAALPNQYLLNTKAGLLY
jgi:hypothetical protein